MKKTNFFVLCVAILSQLTITSCSDKELTEEERRQQQEQQADDQFLLASDFWHVVGQLSTAEVLPDDWQTKTFEPGIGLPSDKSATTRIVLTNQAEAAAESFENLTGADVTNVNSYTWKRDFGTLTYEQLHDGTGWAVVEVDIKQMPGLKRIVYCTPEQQGLNANVAGTPYYRFGDVVKKKNANREWEYWVCVRPCFGPEYKGDSHWMCLGSLPAANIGSYKYKDNREWFWPKSLASNDEHIKNLSEMTYAIMNPEAWQNYYISNQKQSMFHDFSFKNINYHNQYFWKLVQEAWNEPIAEEGGQTVFQLLFHRTMSEVKADKQLRFFYGSGSGPGTFTWNICLTTALVTYPSFRLLNTQKHKKSGDQYSFDIREYSRTGRADNSTYFNENGNNPYIYPLRYLRGDKLLGSNPNNYQSMNGVNDIYDVYVFNKHYKQNVGSQYDMKEFDSSSLEKRTFSYFQPGTVIREKETGKLWICYAGWYDDGTNNVGGHKARFISFSNAIGNEEPYSVGSVSKSGKFMSVNLIPEAEAPMAMAFLFDFARTTDGQPNNAFRNACRQWQKVRTEDFIISYDTISPTSTKTDHLYAFSLAYEPAGRRTLGTQPYIRMVADHSNNSGRSQGDPYLHYYFYKHYNDADRLGELLNLTHLFDAGAWVGSQPIKADRWSRCKLMGTQQRNGDFTQENCYPTSFNNYNYTYTDNQWLYTKGSGSSLPKYTDAYFEPVVMASYLEIDDSKRLDNFVGTYNGKTYELVSYPSPNEIIGTMAMPFAIETSYNGLSFMDEHPFNPIH